MGIVHRPEDILKGRKSRINKSLRDLTPSLKDAVMRILEAWENSGSTRGNYPPCQANRRFTKFLLSGLLSPLLKNYFEHREVLEMVCFLAKTPHDFQFDIPICAHSELKPIIT